MKFSMEWFKAALIRAVRTAAQVALGMLTVGMTISQVDWLIHDLKIDQQVQEMTKSILGKVGEMKTVVTKGASDIGAIRKGSAAQIKTYSELTKLGTDHESALAISKAMFEQKANPGSGSKAWKVGEDLVKSGKLVSQQQADYISKMRENSKRDAVRAITKNRNIATRKAIVDVIIKGKSAEEAISTLNDSRIEAGKRYLKAIQS